MFMNRRNRYDKSFKIMAVELLNSGKSSEEVGLELGIGHDTARKWQKQLESEGETAFPGNGNRSLTKQEQEILDLKRKLRDAELERDILKKAVSIFSKSDRKSSNS